jgi:hypothetical protein
MADFATESGHWYARDGSPAYTMTGANGKERAVTLRDARKIGLVPSVTTILRMENKEALNRWKIQQALLSALTLPRIEGESDDAFLSRALEDSKQQAIAAAARGTYIHGLLEESIKNGWLPPTAAPEDRAIIIPVLGWLSDRFCGWKWSAERSFASVGFGGKIDLHGISPDGNQAVVIDFKVKADIHPNKTLAYDEHITQLAAYAYGIGAPIAQCVNLFIDADMPGVIVPKAWTPAERDTGWECFCCLLKLWQLRRDYAPG